MFSARRTVSALVAATVFVTLAACDSAEAGPGPVLDTGPPGSEISDEVEAALGPKVTLKVDITGAVTVKGVTTATAPTGGRHSLKTCAEYAKGTADGQYLAAGEFDDSIGGRGISLGMWIDDYAGPGTYPQGQIAGPDSRPMVAIDDSVYAVWADGAASSATTDGRGGGSWTFTKLANRREGSSPGDAISGTITWTCGKR
jgi:hypothetical protein